jgi:acylphosphatase
MCGRNSYNPSVIRAKHFLIRGRVQGVGYRYFARNAAERLGICGYVRNLQSGDVEAHAEGEPGVLESFKLELERGPLGAHVREVIESELSPERYTSFQIRGS